MDGTVWIVFSFIVAASSIGVAGEGGAPDRLPTAGQMPILAWCGVEAAPTSVERFRELAEAGFNQNFTSSYASADEFAKALDAAHQAGIKVHACYKDMLKDPAAAAKRFADHPALIAWHIRDEPSAKDFPQLAKFIAEFEAADRHPDHFCYVNLFPNYASTGPNGQLGTADYQEHVDRFLKEVPVKVISFDYYPIVGNSLRPRWYENLEVIAKAAREAKKPFWAFALSVGVATSHGADCLRRLDGLLRSVEEAVPTAQARHQEWLTFALKWAELTALRYEAGATLGTHIAARLCQIQDGLDESFLEWVRGRYCTLHNQPPIPPAMVHHVPRLLAREVVHWADGVNSFR